MNFKNQIVETQQQVHLVDNFKKYIDLFSLRHWKSCKVIKCTYFATNSPARNASQCRHN